LRREIYKLNRSVNSKLIRFYADGTGRGICWALLTPSPRQRRSKKHRRRIGGARRLDS
jgi:hypothetical protein